MGLLLFISVAHAEYLCSEQDQKIWFRDWFEKRESERGEWKREKYHWYKRNPSCINSLYLQGYTDHAVYFSHYC